MKKEQSTPKNQYGLLSMLAMIVGIVIGSGVYVVNNALYSTSNSIGLSTISWIIVSLIVLFMLISFIEISSITMIKGKPGTINNWSKYLIGEKFSKFVGFFFPLIYFPILLFGFSMILASETLSNFDYFTGITQNDVTKIWVYFIVSSFIAFIFLNGIYAMNMFTAKPGKIFQEVGTIIKLIPLFTLILFGIIALAGVFTVDRNYLFDWSSNSNDWESSGSNPFVLILLMAPTVMFSFDGFLFAASLQNESKKKSTYKTAAIFGIILIILVYVIMSLFSFMYGDPETGFSVTQTMVNITGWEWIGYVISAMVIISIATGLSGNSITQNRMIADLSLNNQLRDSNGNLIARNKAMVPQRAAFTAWMMALIAFSIFRIFDTVALVAFTFDSTYVVSSTQNIAFSGFAITGWTLSFLTLISYSFYTILIASAIINRFSKKTEVEKNKAFLPSSFISVFAIFSIVVVFTGSIFAPGEIKINGITSSYNIVTYVMQFFVAALIILAIIFVPIYFEKDVRKAKKAEQLHKEALMKAYNENKVDPRYK